MPSLEVLNTRLDLCAAPGRTPGRILSALAILLLALPGAATAAQGKPGRAGRAARQERLAQAEPPAPPEKAAAPGKPARAPAPAPNPALAAAWKQAMDPLVRAYFARQPWRALERSWPDAEEPTLASRGVGATLRWRDELRDALGGFARLTTEGAGRNGLALGRRLTDWIEAELLLLDAQTQATADPASYVRHAWRTLSAADEAWWLPLEERQARLAAVLADVPTFFRDARLSLMSPPPLWIDLAVRDLDDLESVVSALGPPPPPPLAVLPTSGPAHLRKDKATDGAQGNAQGKQNNGKGKGARPAAAPKPEPTPLMALEAFERWLLELRPGAGGQPPRLDAGEWQRLLRLTSGSAHELGELKSRCLRELARLDLASKEEPRRKRLDTDGLAPRTWNASATALKLAQAARLLPARLEPKGVAFLLEESLRSETSLALVRPGPEASLRAFLQLPHRAWSPELAATRQARLGTTDAQAALGIRYGLTGEALHARLALASRSAPPMLLENRLVREGLGLYALDWLTRIDWIENPLRENEGLARERDFQRGYEAARLVAALEVHAEGLGLEETALGFQRRTGVDLETARGEALAAQRDPLHGCGYLGYLELVALEERLGALTDARKALRVTLLLVQRQPELRPSDIARSLPTMRRPQR